MRANACGEASTGVYGGRRQTGRDGRVLLSTAGWTWRSVHFGVREGEPTHIGVIAPPAHFAEYPYTENHEDYRPPVHSGKLGNRRALCFSYRGAEARHSPARCDRDRPAVEAQIASGIRRGVSRSDRCHRESSATQGPFSGKTQAHDRCRSLSALSSTQTRLSAALFSRSRFPADYWICSPARLH